jgi:hypothetical protein
MMINQVTIQIIYKSAASGSSILQCGDFPLKGKKPEEVAWNWLEQIRREMHVANIEQVIINGEDMTETIKGIDKK